MQASTPLQIDRHISLVERHAGKTLDELVSIHQRNGVGAQHAAMYLRDVGTFPGTPEDFLKMLFELHSRIFGQGEPVIAGRFRQRDEPVYFGREGPYVRCGVAPERIQAELELLFATLPPDVTQLDVNSLSISIARFFERFFMIHPFVDGNGRVGRFVADMMIRGTGRWRWAQRAFSSSERRQYLSALEFARIHTRANEDERCDPTRRDALYPLARWIRRRLVLLEPGWDSLDIDEGAA